MKDYKLDKEEQEILDAYESGKLKPIRNSKKKTEEIRAMARATLAKKRNINIRVQMRDLISLKRKAMDLGLPYQTLVSSILHQYSNRTDKNYKAPSF